MKIFKGNDEFLTTGFIIKSLKELATEDAEKGEYHPAEHICWIAAVALSKMDAVVKGKKPSLLLEEIARWAKQYE
jgi:hypothetical protein